jgi:phosphoglycerate kinase
MDEVSGGVRTLNELEPKGRRVLVRADLNVPMHDGRITDPSRIEGVCPTIRELSEKGARVIVCSHFGRPKGKRVAQMSLAPVATAVGEVLGRRVRFAEDCIGVPAQQGVDLLQDGDVLVLENTRFYPGEEANDPAFAAALAKLAEIYVNDAFSAAHRAHASTEGVAHLLPAYAGRLMQAELEALESALETPVRPVMGVVGGAKVSTKIDLLGNLVSRVNMLVIGGAMANTFLAAQGVAVGKSLQEAGMHGVARDILARAEAAGCRVILPVDAAVADKLAEGVASQTVGVDRVPADAMLLDVGPRTIEAIERALQDARTLVWNGPLGAFETPPFDRATVAFANAVAEATRAGQLRSIAGGGDTVSALRHAGVADALTYVSMAGGAFLEWLEGKKLPGLAALEAAGRR